MIDHMANKNEYVVTHGSGKMPRVNFIGAGTHISTGREFLEVYTSREEAHARAKEIDHSWQPPEDDEDDIEPSRKGSTSKADIWRRATDAEAEVIDALLRDPPPDLGMSPVKLRRLWDDATSIDHTDPLFETIRAIAVEHFGEERADALLKPSE